MKHAQRSIFPRMLETARKEVERLNRAGVIEPSVSKWRSAKVTRKDAYVLPTIDSILNKLRNARYIIKIDLKETYLQYMAFGVSGSGLWQFVRMPFGLTNAPMTFQRLSDALIPSEYEPYVFGYWNHKLE